MTTEEATMKIQTASKKNTKLINWNNGLVTGWLYDLLFEIRAINENVILCDSFQLCATHEKNLTYFRFDNYEDANNKKAEIMNQSSKIRVEIEKVPHNYAMLMKAYNDIYNPKQSLT